MCFLECSKKLIFKQKLIKINRKNRACGGSTRCTDHDPENMHGSVKKQRLASDYFNTYGTLREMAVSPGFKACFLTMSLICSRKGTLKII
jgi:hypothetical protein